MRQDRKVSRDGFVSWEGSLYGIRWKWVETTVQVEERQGRWRSGPAMSGSRCIPERGIPSSVSSLPGQWSGLPRGDNQPRKEAVAMQIPVGEVERRSLDIYELVAGGVA